VEPIAHGTKREQPICCWPDCFEPVEHPDIPLCEGHLRDAGMAWVRDNIDLVRAAVQAIPAHEVVLHEAQQRVEARRLLAQWESAPAVDESAWVVYYIQVRGADRVKIGTTSNLRQRMVALRADGADLLATESGGRTVEGRRHREFADERYGRREEFALSERLLAHIASLQ